VLIQSALSQLQNHKLIVGELESDNDDRILSREELERKLRASYDRIKGLEDKVRLVLKLICDLPSRRLISQPSVKKILNDFKEDKQMKSMSCDDFFKSEITTTHQHLSSKIRHQLLSSSKSLLQSHGESRRLSALLNLNQSKSQPLSRFQNQFPLKNQNLQLLFQLRNQSHQSLSQRLFRNPFRSRWSSTMARKS
jgi:hypothetical protein